MFVKSLLKKVNNLPIRFTIKHYYHFGESIRFLKDKKLDSSQSWDFLRTSHPDFSISQDREEWLKASEVEVRKDGQDKSLKQRAKEVVQVLDRLNIQSIFSVGSGGAGLEYNIKKLRPNIKIICSEYSETNVNLLKKVFLEADSVTLFNMQNRDWPEMLKNKSTLCLIYRIDASFTNKQWREIFENIYSSGVQNVLYIPTNFLTILSIIFRIKRRISGIFKRHKFSFAGYLRTKKTFESYWTSLYDQEFYYFGGLGGFILRRKKSK